MTTGRPKNDWTDFEEKRVRELWETDATQRQIARSIGRSDFFIAQIVKALDLPKRSRVQNWTTDEEEQLIELYGRQGLPVKTVAKRIGRTFRSVGYKAHKMGIMQGTPEGALKLTAEHDLFLDALREAGKTVPEMHSQFCDKFKSDVSLVNFKKAVQRSVTAGGIRRAYARRYHPRPISADKQLKVQAVDIQRRLAGGCQICGADSVGKYCEAHARQAFTRDMSSPRAQEIFTGRF